MTGVSRMNPKNKKVRKIAGVFTFYFLLHLALSAASMLIFSFPWILFQPIIYHEPFVEYFLLIGPAYSVLIAGLTALISYKKRWLYSLGVFVFLLIVGAGFFNTRLTFYGFFPFGTERGGI